jgi:membrane dipeptidase
VIDGHNDLPWAMRKLCDYDLDRVDLARRVNELHTDIGRLREGGVTGQFWSVYVPSTLSGPEAVSATLEQIAFVYKMTERYPNDFAIALSAHDVIAANNSGHIASMLGMEGGHSINESLGVLQMMAQLGVRYMTLTHNDNVPWADSATDEPVLGGLNDFGHEVIREMNRLGMMVDLSHVSADVMRQAIAASESPVMFSHSSARAVCDVARNVPDDVLESLSDNNGICMVTFVADFISPAVANWFEECKDIVANSGGNPRDLAEVDVVVHQRLRESAPPVATIADVVTHIEHMREVAGIHHIGIGGDFDGTTLVSAELPDVSAYPKLFTALNNRRWSTTDIENLCTENILRVMRANEEAATR